MGVVSEMMRSDKLICLVELNPYKYYCLSKMKPIVQIFFRIVQLEIGRS